MERYAGTNVSVIRNALRSAMRFTLDEQAVQYFAEMMRDIPEVVAMAHEFALRPFDVMYVEIPFYDQFYKIVTGFDPTLDADVGLGYLYVGPDVYAIAVSPDQEPVIGPFKYRLGTPWKHSLSTEAKFPFSLSFEGMDKDVTIERGEDLIDALFWGSSLMKITPEQRVVLREHNTVTSLFLNNIETAMQMESLFTACASDLRNIIGLLLFLNQTRDIQYVEELGHHKGFIKAKPSTFLKHSVIRLKISPMPMLRKKLIGESGGLWRREHAVKGHFCHDKTTREHRSCLHDWAEYDVNQWKCRQCGGLRWWRRDHRRGHRDKGIVSQEYQVTA